MATYLNLTNELLRRLNESAVDASDFSSVRNVQALAKDSINSAVREILQVAQEWPFTRVTYTQTCSAGVGTYAFPANYSSVDWETFYVKKNTSVDNFPGALTAVEYNYYIKHLRGKDDNAGSSGYDTPEYVYQTQGSSFGLSPVPDAAYEVEYTYWSYPDDMSAATDVCVVPDRFKHVIIDGAMMYMMRFRSNEQSAAMHQSRFEDGIKMMRRLLLDEVFEMRSRVLQRG